jgi:hypothetical protein
VLVLLVCGASGCGGSESNPSAESLVEKAEELKAEALLVRAELIEAELHELPKASTSTFGAAKRGAVRDAVKVERACHLGNGLEECGKLREIEQIVHQIREAHL